MTEPHVAWVAEFDPHLPTIDLHGVEYISDALEILEGELYKLVQQKEIRCRVIHGFGTGALAAAVHKTLDAHPLVREWTESENGGSCLVVF